MVNPPGVTGAVGKEALKPIGSAVEALASPWIARLRQWAEDRDLQRRLDAPDLSDSFRAFARRLNDRVSVISTVITRDPLPLAEIYEPLTLISRDTQSAEPGDESNLMREGGRIFVVDGAGMGKSTFARYMISEALRADDFVPVLLELRRIQDGESLVDALSREFDEIDRPFDRKLLHRLFTIGRFFFVLDGLDEVGTERRPALVSEIEAFGVAVERSAIVLTTRPETALPTLPGAKTFRIRPLSMAQASALVHRFDHALGNVEIGQRLVREFRRIPRRLLQTPLLVALLYRTFDYTKTIEPKLSTFYDDFYAALYKGHDLTKSSFVRRKECGLDVDEFRRLLRGFAFLVVAEQKASIAGEAEAQRLAGDASRITSVTPRSPAAFVDDLLLAVPLLVREGTELRFVHYSIAEWLAASYLAIGNPESEQMIADIRGGPLLLRFLGVFDFLEDLDLPLFRRAIVLPIAEEARAHQPDEADLFVRTMTFFGEVHVAWFEGGFPGAVDVPVSGPGTDVDGVHLGEGDEEYTVVAAWNHGRDHITPTIWGQISTSLLVTESSGDWTPDISTIGDDSHLDPSLGAGGNLLKSAIPSGTWYPITAREVRLALESDDVRNLLASVLFGFVPIYRSEFRLLSDVEIDGVLAHVQSDQAARQSLRQLLSRPS